jgi:4-hydroxy 2-oxovalerate aldolase
MRTITISDPSLRDGNHCVKHKIDLPSVARYCKFADDAGIPIVEVGHGNGLGASSLLIGLMPHSDTEMLTVARENLKKAKLGVHVIPGLGTIKKDIQPALDVGVDIFRVASHVTEANVTQKHIEFVRSKGKVAYGVLMMSALVDTKTLVSEAKKMEDYGAETFLIMDSTGTYMPRDVEDRIKALKDNLSIPIGFHGHNNLGLAVANSLVAVQCGADIIDACIRGFGAGAGNTQLEVIIPILEQYGFNTNIDFQKVIIEADKVTEYMVKTIPVTAPINVLTGLHKLFSGFEKPIIKASKLYGLQYSSLIFELGNRKLVAGQEDLILEVAQNLKKKPTESSDNGWERVSCP